MSIAEELRAGTKARVSRPPKILVTAAEAAAMLSIGERSLWRLVEAGLVPAPLKIGLPGKKSGQKRTSRWPVATLRDWAEAGCPPAATLKP